MSALGNDSSAFLCFNQSLLLVRVAALINLALASVVVTTSSAAIVILLCLNKHRVHIQRLVIYVTFAVLLQAISSVMNGISVLLLLAVNEQSYTHFCQVNGFIGNWILWTEFILIGWITVDVLLVVVFSLFTNWKMELVQLVTSFAIPPLVLWIPLKFDGYGFNDGVCGIQLLDYDDCVRNTAGYVTLVAVHLLPLSTLLPFIGTLYFAVFAVLKRRERMCHGKDPKCSEELVHLRQRVWLLAAYPAILFLFLLPSSVQFSVELVLDMEGGRIWITFMNIISHNCAGFLFSLAFILDIQTCRHIWLCCSKGFCYAKQVEAETLQGISISWTDSLRRPVRTLPSVHAHC